ncbi:ATP-binding protein [Algoriphagus sp. C2-6-M1]|uniref:ATP-binding protein n=1 Tax=Algoriphagus persicinus TaxID=3108754 RepID=UPI002B3EF85D|nr:ATP-binding protein [Algoriphagus sp. C2-6-M1]MEB2782331.1 ATP-binding protein [Algoriphagus sp. C2-6-M1]
MIRNLTLEIRNSANDSLNSEYYLELASLTQNRNPDSSIYYGEKAFDLASKSQNTSVQVGALGIMAGANRNKGDLPKSIEISLRALQLGKNIPVRIAAGIGPAYSNLGNTYIQIGDYERAKNYLEKLIALGHQDQLGVAYGHYYLASIYEKQNKLDTAQYHLDKCYEEFKTIKFGPYPNVYDVYPPWYNLRAKIYLNKGQDQLALSDYFHVLEMTRRNDEPFFSSATYNDIASYYKQKNQIDSVIYYAEKGLTEAKIYSTQKEILRSSEILSEYYEKQNPAQALAYLKLANKTRNTFYGAGNMQVMRDMIEENDKKQNEIIAAEMANRNRLIMGGILGIASLLLITAIFLYRNNRTKQKAKLKIEAAYQQLKSTQAQLIQSEKMASLGELTAGIAHEIQNPLNFVNNFSEVSTELVDEMKEELVAGTEASVQFAVEIADDLKQNLEKITLHGKRADAIVKGMLEHSKRGSGQKEPTDLNALADEFLRLSYQFFLAKEPEFKAELKTDFDPNLPKVSVIPQDIGKVLLNLMNNAFYACAERSRSTVNEKAKSENTDSDFKPMIQVSTRQLLPEGGKGGYIEISVSDNGSGVPDSIKEKIFQPFFTTKPTGSGTGLGLSLSYDIVKAHGGELRVDSSDGMGAEFIIQLPAKGN